MAARDPDAKQYGKKIDVIKLFATCGSAEIDVRFNRETEIFAAKVDEVWNTAKSFKELEQKVEKAFKEARETTYSPYIYIDSFEKWANTTFNGRHTSAELKVIYHALLLSDRVFKETSLITGREREFRLCFDVDSVVEVDGKLVLNKEKPWCAPVTPHRFYPDEHRNDAVIEFTDVRWRTLEELCQALEELRSRLEGLIKSGQMAQALEAGSVKLLGPKEES